MHRIGLLDLPEDVLVQHILGRLDFVMFSDARWYALANSLHTTR